MKHRRMSVGRVRLIHRAFIMNQGVGLNVLRYEKGWHPDAEAGKVVGDIVAVGHAGEGDAILWGRDVDWWKDVVGEATMLVEIDDDQSVIPVFALSDRIVNVLDQLLASRHVGSRMH